ncbi:hypothetical protein EBZ39_10110 [bacterium]|nr:hypothetical protein [bacterium]
MTKPRKKRFNQRTETPIDPADVVELPDIVEEYDGVEGFEARTSMEKNPIVTHVNRIRRFLSGVHNISDQPNHPGAAEQAKSHPMYAEFLKNAKTLESQLKMAPDMLALHSFKTAKRQQEVMHKLENLDVEGKLPVFLSNAAMFKDIMAAGLPPLAQKIQTFLMATPVREQTKNGPVNILPANVDMTPDQVKMAIKLTDKFIPAQLPMDMAGQQLQAGQTKIEVGITQVGSTPDYGSLPGEVNGIPSGATVPQQNTTVTFRTVGPNGEINEMQVGMGSPQPNAQNPVDVTPEMKPHPFDTAHIPAYDVPVDFVPRHEQRTVNTHEEASGDVSGPR